MGYAAGLKSILDDAVSRIEGLEDNENGDPVFQTVIRGWKRRLVNAEKPDQFYPVCAIVLRNDPLEEQQGALSEKRNVALEFWTINNESHDTALELVGAIVDEIEEDLTFDGEANWSTLDNVEMYINVGAGFDLHWGKVTFTVERRRQRDA